MAILLLYRCLDTAVASTLIVLQRLVLILFYSREALSRRQMAASPLVTKHPSYKLVLSLLFLTTMTSSLGIQPSSQVVERKQRNRPSIDRYGKISNAVILPSWQRLFAGSGSRISPVSTVQRDSRVAERILPADREQFPAKRRWNSGNLRVWGKRSSSYDAQRDGWVEKVPLWLLSARVIDNGQALDYAQSSDASASEADERRVDGGPWDRTPLRVWAERTDET